MIRLLNVDSLEHFVFNGEVRELREPDGAPTARQLLKLNALGALALVEPGQVASITKGEAAGALDVLVEPEAA